jgi:hypothetical protein
MVRGKGIGLAVGFASFCFSVWLLVMESSVNQSVLGIFSQNGRPGQRRKL